MHDQKSLKIQYISTVFIIKTNVIQERNKVSIIFIKTMKICIFIYMNYILEIKLYNWKNYSIKNIFLKKKWIAKKSVIIFTLT